MTCAAEIHDSSLVSSFGYLLQDQIGEQKVPNVVGCKLGLDFIFIQLIRAVHNSGIVDQNVELWSIVPCVEILGCFTYFPLRRKI